MVRVSAAVAGVLCCLLCSSAIAAVVNIDVGAAAVNGVWRPTSCDQVKDGVVLSNIGDNIKAVIEGCAISVVGADTDVAAVQVSGDIGTSSSLELHRCTVTLTHTHATHRGDAIKLAGFKAGSTVILDNTTVTVTTVGPSNAVYLPTLLGSRSDAVAIIVRNGSTIFATSTTSTAFGIDFTGTASGDNFTAIVEESHINVTGAQRVVGFSAPTTTFGAGAQITFNNSHIQQHSADENDQTNAAVYFAGTAGAELKWTIVNTVIEGHGVQAVYWGPTLAARDSLVIDSSNISATNTRSTSAFTHNKGRNIQIRRSVLSAEGALSVNALLIRVDATAIDLTIDACTLSSNSPGTASVILSFGPLQSSSISIARSALVFYSGEKNTLYPPGGITLTWSAWTDVAMTLTHVSITALPGTTNDTNLILWPELKGTSVQKLDHVSLSPPDDRAMTIFSVARAASAQSTLCRRMVTYGNGTDLPEALMPGLPAGDNCVWPDSPVTIDVSSKAVANVSRPSCDEVKNGVVLTNFGDNIKAVIEGCDIYVNTWGNSELAAVHVDGAIGAQASLEFRDCNITLSHTATDDRVNTIVLPHIGAGGSFILDNTTVSVTCLGDAAAVYFRSVTCGANVSIIIRNGSELRANSIADAGTGIDFGRMGSTFGDFATFLIDDSALNITGKSGGSGIASNHDTFGDNLTFTLKNSRIFIASSDSGDDSTAIEFVGTVGAHFRALVVNTVIEGQHAKALYWQPRVGPDDLFTVEESNFTALITDGGDAFYLRNAVNLRVLKSTIAVEGPAADTIALRIHSTAKQAMHIVVSESTLRAISQTTAVAFFAEIQLENSTIEFVDSSLEFRAGGRASYPPGGIAAIFHPWTDTTMTLINTKITALQGTVTNANATFITWPELRGASRQVLDRVVFAAPDGVVVEPYAIPAATPPSTSSLCSRGLVWANGTRFPAVPRFTVAPSCTWPDSPVTVDVSAKAVGNVWRPSSCDEVKNGVVLKNFGDNMQAIIEGCAIDLTAWDDSSLSAVSLAAPLGAHASLILRQCTITASYTHPTAVSHAIKIGMINKGLSVILENTTVSVSSVADSIGVSVPVGILFVSPSQIENITLAVKNGSTIAVSSANESAIGMSLANTFFGNYFNVLVQDATVNATGERATCFSAPTSTFANNASVTIRSSRFYQAAVNPDDDAGAAVYFAGTVGSDFQWRMVDTVVKARGKQAVFWAPTLGSSDLLLIEASTIEAVNTGAAIAFAFEKGRSTHIRGSSISAESQESAVSFSIERATVIHLVVADGSTLVAKGPRTAASLLSMSVVASSSFQFLDSTLAFESTGRGAEQSGGMVAGLNPRQGVV